MKKNTVEISHRCMNCNVGVPAKEIPSHLNEIHGIEKGASGIKELLESLDGENFYEQHYRIKFRDIIFHQTIKGSRREF